MFGYMSLSKRFANNLILSIFLQYILQNYIQESRVYIFVVVRIPQMGNSLKGDFFFFCQRDIEMEIFFFLHLVQLNECSDRSLRFQTPLKGAIARIKYRSLSCMD
eukprot:TRINITY_DN44576_c0_g1_i1.p3 TRINITY_DN44576_c0_g1~~TRINITY_DN44576_c0_g1_i1.p3  ORF type:complete len:105 (-),score=4.55 TRINITY_DN44576_c0_g1_i1:55-369(-)